MYYLKFKGSDYKPIDNIFNTCINMFDNQSLSDLINYDTKTNYITKEQIKVFKNNFNSIYIKNNANTTSLDSKLIEEESDFGLIKKEIIPLSDKTLNDSDNYYIELSDNIQYSIYNKLNFISELLNTTSLKESFKKVKRIDQFKDDLSLFIKLLNNDGRYGSYNVDNINYGNPYSLKFNDYKLFYKQKHESYSKIIINILSKKEFNSRDYKTIKKIGKTKYIDSDKVKTALNFIKSKILLQNPKGVKNKLYQFLLN